MKKYTVERSTYHVFFEVLHILSMYVCNHVNTQKISERPHTKQRKERVAGVAFKGAGLQTFGFVIYLSN